MSNTNTKRTLLPPHYLALSVLSMLGLFMAIDTPGLLPGPWRFWGLLPLVAGLAVATQGSRQFAMAGTNIVPFTQSTALVTAGVFHYSRNPMYLGMSAFLVGIATLLNEPWPWLAVIGFIAIIRLQFIQGEEALMLETFGDEYRAYQAGTARWLGLSGKRQSANVERP